MKTRRGLFLDPAVSLLVFVSNLAALCALSTAVLMLYPGHRALGAPPPKAVPVPQTAQSSGQAPDTAKPEADLVSSIPLPPKRIQIQYSIDKDGIRSGGKLNSLIGKVMATSLEHTKLIYELKATQLHVSFQDLREGDDGIKFSSRSQMQPSGSVLKETQNSGRETEITEAKVENISFLGRSKAVRWFDSEDLERQGGPKGGSAEASRESFIDPEEIITTLLQVPVWASTIRGDLGRQPVPFRMCVKGDPLLMRLTEGPAASEDEVVYLCERAGSNSAGGEALFTLTYSRQEMLKGFAMPVKMQIHVGTMAMNVRRDRLKP